MFLNDSQPALGSAATAQLIILSSEQESNLQIAAAAFFVYDYVLTFPSEVELIWPRIRTVPGILYTLCRVVGWLNALSNMMAPVNWITTQSCGFALVLGNAGPPLVYAIWALFTTLRVTAVSGGKLWLGLCALVILTAPVAICVYEESPQEGFWLWQITSTTTYCQDGIVDSDETMMIYLGVSLSTYGAFIVADLLALTVTWWKTYTLRQQAKKHNVRTSLVTTLVRDGTFYFLGILVLNLVEMLLWLFTVVWPISTVDIDFYPIIQAYITVVIARFILGIRSAAVKKGSSSADPSDTTPQPSSVRFASNLARSMGGEVDGTFEIGTFNAESDSELVGVDEVEVSGADDGIGIRVPADSELAITQVLETIEIPS